MPHGISPPPGVACTTNKEGSKDTKRFQALYRPEHVALKQGLRRGSGQLSALIHPSAWKGNSRKFAVASDSSRQRQSFDNSPCFASLGSKRSDLVAVVAPMCIKGLRLVTVQLPEKSWPFGPALNELRPNGVLGSSQVLASSARELQEMERFLSSPWPSLSEPPDQ